MEHWRNTGTLAEQQNTGGTIGIPRNSGTCGKQWNNAKTRQHQEIQNKKVILAKRIFME